MKTDPSNSVNQEEIDWFVEGGMDAEERSDLFGRLDRSADGWRRCALALMERDALKHSLTAARQSIRLKSPIGSAAPTSRVVAGKSGNAGQHWKRAIPWTIAAALLFAFGLWLGRYSGTAPENLAGRVDSSEVPMIDNEISLRIAEHDPQTLFDVNTAVSKLSVSDGQLIAVVAVQRDSDMQFFPVIESKTLEQQLIDLPTPLVSQDYAKKLHRAGWKLDYARQFLSLHLPNGKNQVMPVDMFNYHYVGPQIF